MKTLSRIRELANPLHMIFPRTGMERIAPSGNWALSADKDTNESLWNTVTVAGWAIPTAMLAALAANKIHENKMNKAIKQAELDNINSLRPVISPNADLGYTKNIEHRPGKELEMVEGIQRMLEKKSSASDYVAAAAQNALPFTVLPLALLAAAHLTNKSREAVIKDALKAERIKLQNMQDAVDADMLARRGLIDNVKENKPIKKEAGILSDIKTGSDAVTETVGDVGTDAYRLVAKVPPAAMIATFALLSLGGATLLHKWDSNEKKLDFVRKKMLGENRLSETPEIDFEFIPGITSKKKPEVAQAIEGIPSGSSKDSFF